MSSESFFGVMTIGAHHSVGSVTEEMTPWLCSKSSSALSLSQYANGTARGVLTQKGSALSAKHM